MRNYEKYTFYKEVWNKSFPSNWELLPLYALGKVKSITEQTDLQLLSVYLDAGVIPFASKAEKRTNVTSKDLSKYQRVDPGDFVLNNQQAWRGSVGVSFDTGIVSPAYIVLEMNDKLDPRFANYLFRARIMVDQYLINSKSVGSIQRNIYWPALKRTRVPVPSHSEQEQIIRYLDWKISGINGLINLKKKEIENLKELRNSAIDDGILHGFHTGDMKDSDIYWLGSVFSSAGNHQGLQIINSEYQDINVFEKIFEQFRNDYLTIPAAPEMKFFSAQKEAYDHLTDPCFSYSGPTSMGKSFIMRMFIKDEILHGAKKNYALIVPTKALINEVRSKIINDLEDNLKRCNYRVVTAASDIALEEKHNFIFVLTPERLLYLLISNPSLEVDYLFVDEAHKLSGKNSRGPFYYKVVDSSYRSNVE